MLMIEPQLSSNSLYQLDSQTCTFASSHPHQTVSFPISDDLDFDLDRALSEQSIAASPASTQSILSQYSRVHAPLSGVDSIPSIAVSRSQLRAQDTTPGVLGQANLMHTDSSWVPTGQLTPRSATRFASHHNRESSLSSLGSAGPASPYSHSTANPHIAIADSSAGDGFHGMSVTEDFNGNYQLATNTKTFSGQGTFYPNYPSFAPVNGSTHPMYPNNAIASSNRQPNGDRSLLPAPEIPSSLPNRPRPVSVASSVAGDSPITPAGEPDECARRRKIAFPAAPKLDRTMTDIYGDELFNPNFTITSASPGQVTISPSNDVFVQRLQTANSQHLSAVHSPVSTTSHGSPFRHGSPLAPAPSHDFSTTSVPPTHMVFGTSQQLREQRKAAEDAQAMQQQLAPESNLGTPQTISPQDAVIEYHSPEGEANFPLFPQQGGATSFNVDHLKGVSQATHPFNNLSVDGASFGGFVGTQLPANIAASQPYPYVSQGGPIHQQGGLTPSSSVSRPSSTDSGQSDTTRSTMNMQRPSGTAADGGTYTCTYHGCTLRFETPTLLQKHKREGHRNAHGLAGPRRAEPAGAGMTSTLLNSQAGPHKCDRINPSTGKPCNIMFSRPYDLTRHEDTIHNARKQKVRCNLCTDEKTFSRADALTRHYRVCHPHVEFPGKHRRRGA